MMGGDARKAPGLKGQQGNRVMFSAKFQLYFLKLVLKPTGRMA